MKRLRIFLASLAIGLTLFGVSAVTNIPPAETAQAQGVWCGHPYPQGIHRVSSSGTPKYHLVTGFIRSWDGRLILNFTNYAWRYLGNGTYGWVPISSQQLVCGIVA